MTVEPIVIVVYGTAQPAGSKKSSAVYRKDKQTGNPVPATYRDAAGNERVLTTVRDDNDASKPWKETIGWTARQQFSGPLLTEALRVDVRFEIPRIKGHYGTGRNERALKDSAPLRPAKRPDLDKLRRAVMDGLTGVVWRDDALCTEGYSEKRYVEAWEPARVVVVITALPDRVVRVVAQE